MYQIFQLLLTLHFIGFRNRRSWTTLIGNWQGSWCSTLAFPTYDYHSGSLFYFFSFFEKWFPHPFFPSARKHFILASCIPFLNSKAIINMNVCEEKKKNVFENHFPLSFIKCSTVCLVAKKIWANVYGGFVSLRSIPDVFGRPASSAGWCCCKFNLSCSWCRPLGHVLIFSHFGVLLYALRCNLLDFH